MSAAKGPGLYDFLIEAELQQYFASFKNDLKIQTASQLKFVSDEDLQQLGMSKPEMRRLKKYFQKHFPQNYISKLKKMIVNKKEENGQSLMASMLSDECVDRPPVRVPNKHIIPADSIIVNKELGTGEFGVVQQGVWTNDGDRIQVAIKCLSRERMQSNPIEFLKEAAIMHGIEHEHIVRLYGVVLDTNALMLVTELAPLRSLLECLKEPSLRFSFPVLTLCDFAIQICDGMQYLEAKRLIHRDLAARNILVFSKNKVKISDFGLSRALGVGKDYYQTNFNVNLKLPIAWCAPECISYLRFTSASDVWAYGVTLWEMFSYGFQPWAALTGHQILEAIDEPNFQRLEQPDCCPKEYYSLMLKCWQHDPIKRPRFSDLISLLPDYKPEQVQAVQELGDERIKREQLVYRLGEVITVLDKSPLSGIANCWKGVVNSGKTGLFNPAHTVAYLGNNLPSNKPGQFTRGDGKNMYSSRRNRLRPDMISHPQGDLKHTGHVGLDGAYFGDLSFLGGTKYDGIPHQVVTPYKPHEDSSVEAESRSCSDRAPLLQSSHSSSSNGLSSVGVSDWGETKPLTKLLSTDHEYHEISDEETVPDSPHFDPFDLGPSLMDEMDAVLRCFGGEAPPPPAPPNRPPSSPPPPPSPLDDTINKRNEIREMQNTLSKAKKKQATVKPISAADEKTLDSAIAMANELAARSMNDLGGDRPPSAPISPASPNKRKFSFRFPSTAGPAAAGKQHTRSEGKTFTDEAASIPDIQSLCSSLRSLSSCTSLESLRSGAPFRLPLWDRASAEFCFARSRDLLTRVPPRLDSSMELLESSEADETMSAPFDMKHQARNLLSNDMSNKNDSDFWKLRRQMKDYGAKYRREGISGSCTLSNDGTVTKSQSTDSASTLDACPSISDLNESSTLKDCNGYERTASLKGLSLSSLNECSDMSGYTLTDVNKSSYENIFSSTRNYNSQKTNNLGSVGSVTRSNLETNGFAELEKLEAEFRTPDRFHDSHLNKAAGFSAEIKPLSRFLNKFPELDDSPGQSFKPIDKSALNLTSRSSTDYPTRRDNSRSPEKFSKYTEKYPQENSQVPRLSFKQLEKHLDSLDLKKRSIENIPSFNENSVVGKSEEPRRTGQVTRAKQFVPATPIFRRKVSQPKMGLGETSRMSTRSSPNSPSITVPKVYFRPRTSSLSEEKKRPPPSRRQSYNYSAHYDTSSSDSEFDGPSALCQGQRSRPTAYKPSRNWPSSSSSSSSNDYPEFSDDFLTLSSSHQECVTPEAQAAYNVLVEQPTHDTNPLRMLRAVPFVRPRVRGNKNTCTLPFPTASSHKAAGDSVSRCSNTLPHRLSCEDSANPVINKPDTDTDDDCASDKREGALANPVPLPPRDRNKPLVTNKPRHQRKHPLIIPGAATRTLARLNGHPLEPTYLGLEDEPSADPVTEDDGESDEEITSDTHPHPQPQPLPRTVHDIAEVVGEAFEERIACELDALEQMDEEVGEEEGRALREHVSCEDLLEFACDVPNARRTRGKTSGVNSDEVRIMGKVLGNKVSEESRLAALNTTDWDVHRAIKLCRLDTLLPPELCVDSVAKLTALYDSGWDVARTAGLLLATQQPREDITQV